MLYCLNPNCQNPQIPGALETCQTCGMALRLQSRYVAIRPIGQGGFGRTSLAIDALQAGKPRCVIKQFYPQQQGTDNLAKASQLFRQEAQRLKELGEHPQIPDLLDYLEQDGYQYLIQEFIDGYTLEQDLADSGVFSEQKIRQLLQELLPIIQFIHNHQIIHRDIKPANIIRRTSDRHLFLVDLGAAKQATGTALAKTGTVIGSAEYTAPEQSRGKAVFASDLYSLGATCIHLLTGMSPFDLFDGGNGCWVWQDYLWQPISDSLKRLLDKMLQQATNLRYPSVASVLEDLCQPERRILVDRSLGQQPSLPQDHASLLEQERSGQSFNVNYEQGGKITSSSATSSSAKERELQNQRKSSWDDYFYLQGESQVKGRILAALFLVFGLPLFFFVIPSILLQRITSPTPAPPLSSGAIPAPTEKAKPRLTNPVKPVYTLATSGVVTSLAISRDGKTLVSSNVDRQVWTMSTYSNKLVPETNNNIQLWNLSAGSLASTIPTQYPVFSVALSPDGRTLASQFYRAAEGQWTTQIWTTDNGQLLRTLPPSTVGLFTEFSPDGKFVGSGVKQGIGIWEVSTGRQVQTLVDGRTAIAFSPSNNDVSAGFTNDSRNITLWNWRTGQVVALLEAFKDSDTNNRRKPIFRSDGQMLIGGFNKAGNESFLQTWDLGTSKLGRRFDQVGRVLSLAISPDDTLLVSTGEMMLDKGFIHLWNLRTGELVRTINMPDIVVSVVFSPDGKQLICGGADQQITVWQVGRLTSGWF